MWGPHVVIAPLSVLSSWKGDALKLCGDRLNLYVHHGLPADRLEGLEKWRGSLCKAVKSSTATAKPDRPAILLTTYDMAIKDLQFLHRLSSKKLGIRWQFLVVGELIGDFIDYYYCFVCSIVSC